MPPPIQIPRKETDTGRGGTAVTTEMRREWQRLGKQGVGKAGGFAGVARQYSIATGTLNRYLRVDGTLSKRAEDRLNPPGSELTLEMLREWKALGQAGIEAAGGFDGVARRDNVPAAALRRYLRADGSLTPFGENRLRKAGTRPM